MANKARGARWEATLLHGLRELGLDVERQHLAGARDEGDLVIRLPDAEFIVIEAKSGKLHPRQFIREAQREAAAFAEARGVHGSQVRPVVFVRDPGMPWHQGFAFKSIADELGLVTG